MKRIFLTSGLVVCMACPAFATLDLDTSGNVNGYPNECVEPVLGVYDAPANNPVQLEAKWAANVSGAIALDSSKYAASDSATAQYTATTAAAPTPLYSVYATGIYSSSADAAAQTSAISAITTAPEVTGYNFAGFYTGKAGTGTQVINTDKSFTSDATTQVSSTGGTATWYAHWTAKQFDVTYAPGDHSASNSYVDPTKAVYDGAYSVLAQNTTGITANAGYTFTGWRDETHSIDYAAGTSTISPWKYTDGITLTAQYSANPYQITYAGGTAGSRPVTTVAMSATNVNYDETNITLATNTYAIDGYHFTGWSGDHDASDGSATTTPYTAGATIAQYKVVGNLGLTAQWVANTTTVTYNCGSQSGVTGSAPASQTATYDQNFAFAANSGSCARAGYDFTGWTCTYGDNPATTLTMAAAYGTSDEHATDTVMAAGGTAATWLYTGADQGSISCVATYSAHEIHVNWYKNAGTDDTLLEQNTCIYDSTLDVPANPTRNGYQFTGWTVRTNNNQQQ